MEHLLFRATLEEYPKLAREYSYWAEKLAEREKVSNKRRADSDEDDDDDEKDDDAEDLGDDDGDEEDEE